MINILKMAGIREKSVGLTVEKSVLSTVFRVGFLGKKRLVCTMCVNIGGECEIRTHDRLASMLVFKTSAFNHSANSP